MSIMNRFLLRPLLSDYCKCSDLACTHSFTFCLLSTVFELLSFPDVPPLQWQISSFIFIFILQDSPYIRITIKQQNLHS